MDLCGDYDGEMSGNRMNGVGTYENANGKFVGEFENGKFHGQGTFYCPKSKGGGRWEGYWENDVMVEGKFIFDDDLVYEQSNWAYCSQRDPRFAAELKSGDVNKMGPLRDDMAVQENLKRLPKGCYDTVDGYLDPKTFIIHEYGTGNQVRRPEQAEREHIIANYRFGDVEIEEAPPSEAPPSGTDKVE